MAISSGIRRAILGLSCAAAMLSIGYRAFGTPPDEMQYETGPGASEPTGQAAGASDWWAPGGDYRLTGQVDFPNDFGTVGVLNHGSDVSTRGHPFFTPIGRNGRACVSCHQPSAGMSITPALLRKRWEATGGRDPVFAAIDGSNCPSLPQRSRASHSLLLDHGLIRIGLAWPPRSPNGTAIRPEFDIEVVSDPTGCNLDSQYGINSANPTVSVFRRPRLPANLRYSASVLGRWDVKLGRVLPRDPVTGKFLNNNILADNRQNSLEGQATEAALSHLQAKGPPSAAVIGQIVQFERQLYVAQSSDKVGGWLNTGGASAGPRALATGKAGVLGVYPGRPPFPELEGWKTASALAGLKGTFIFPRPAPAAVRPDQERETRSQREFRDSVARGYEIYAYRAFVIDDVSRLNSVGLGNPMKLSCINCHNMQRTGMDNAPGYMDIGTANIARQAIATPYLPLFRITCHQDAPPHPYLGRVILTHDPGRALISGLCADVGAINMQQIRGLAARPPYFSNGLAATIADIVEFYDKRFNMKLDPQEKADLANVLRVL
ncbi:hypothetical protein [Aquisediminimonas profunda]|uniref:hypothetical protein n=1 Tax=Aquisediminimonas profunda TaxID=1550733 RepID=UPI001C6258D8|nr:hypothetical protein [Aquisediminimonas profunda]